MSEQNGKKRVLVFIVAYNAEKTIEDVLRRIPEELADAFYTEVLIIDDSSQDQTFERGHAVKKVGALPFKLNVLFNPVNQGYGGNQKIGFHFAIENGFDYVALVHGDGQYAPECLPELLQPLAAGEADAVFGSRMLTRGAALSGGMPYYKFVGNKILTTFQNVMMRGQLSEFHSGYRLYAVDALKRIPFHLNTNVFHFDTEIIYQFIINGLRIKEQPIPTYYGDEICHVDGLKYAWDVFLATLRARAQELSLFYDRKFDCASTDDGNTHYLPKLEFESPHTLALRAMNANAKVLDIGCGDGRLSRAIQDRGYQVTGIDIIEPADDIQLENFIVHDLNSEELPVSVDDYDYVLMLDVIEHLLAPEAFASRLSRISGSAQDTRMIVSTGNVAFLIVRLMLLFGQFNYGKKGILDLTHTRLFTFATMRRLFEQSGFEVLEQKGVAAPFTMVLGDNIWSRALFSLNRFLIRIWKQAFSYQIFMIVRPRPSLAALLQDAEVHSANRIKATEENEAETSVKSA